MNNTPFCLESTLYLSKRNEEFLNLKKVQLLENIMIYGSMSKAAEASGVTYKTAWAWVEKMNSLSPKPLVQKISGGKGGGGTLVTSFAKELIQRYEEVEALHQKHLASLQESFEDMEGEALKGFSFSSLDAEVLQITIHGKRATLTLRLSSSDEISVQTSVDFVKANEVEVGLPVSVLIESEAVSLSKFDEKEISSRNRLNTRVNKVSINGDDVLLSLGLSNETELTSRITHKSYKDMDIKVGDKLVAMFKAYSATVFVKGKKN